MIPVVFFNYILVLKRFFNIAVHVEGKQYMVSLCTFLPILLWAQNCFQIQDLKKKIVLLIRHYSLAQNASGASYCLWNKIQTTDKALCVSYLLVHLHVVLLLHLIIQTHWSLLTSSNLPTSFLPQSTCTACFLLDPLSLTRNFCLISSLLSFKCTLSKLSPGLFKVLVQYSPQ
jgi:hypothetical protein